MVAHLLRLRLDLLWGALRGERRTRTIVLLLLTIAATALICGGLLSLRDDPTPVAATVVILGSAAVFIGFLLTPILAGARDPLDPRRFTVFGVDERRMPALLALVSLVSVPSAALLAVTVCTVMLAVAHGVPVLLAILLAMLGTASILLAARIGMAFSAAVLPERRPREMTALFALAVAVVAFPAAIFLASQEWGARIPESVATATSLLGMTPFGAAAAAAFAAASADPAAAWVSGLIAAATAAGLWLLWTLLARHLLTSTQRPGVARERTGLGWFSAMPANAFGAIAARSLSYWLRDRRYIVNMLIVPIVAVLAALPLLIVGVPERLVLAVPVLLMALFLGWLPHNDIAYDSTAFWIHVASGASGWADRLGRLVPTLLVAIPLLAVAIPVTLILVDDWSLLPGLVATVACLLLGGLGLSSVTSVLAPYSVSRPGDSPFQQPQRSSGHGGAGHAIALLGALAVSAPTLWLLVQQLLHDATGEGTFWAGLGTGAVVLVLGVALGARIYSRRGERLMEFVSTS